MLISQHYLHPEPGMACLTWDQVGMQFARRLSLRVRILMLQRLLRKSGLKSLETVC